MNKQEIIKYCTTLPSIFEDYPYCSNETFKK